MNTGDEKGSAINLAGDELLPLPGEFTPADLAELAGLFRHFYFDGATNFAAPPGIVFTGVAAPIMQARLRRY